MKLDTRIKANDDILIWWLFNTNRFIYCILEFSEILIHSNMSHLNFK